MILTQQREIRPQGKQHCCRPYPHSTRCPGTDPIAVSIPRAEGSGVRTVNTALARSPELSKVTPPCCKEGGGGGQQHT